MVVLIEKTMGVVMNSEDFKIKPRSNWVSTSLQGYITASYADLVEVFGKPQITETSGDGKVDIEWELQVEDYDFNSIFPLTIYNWKDYDGGLTAETQSDYRWHIGGDRKTVASYVQQYFNNMMETV
jgi:hypothetical protein